MNELSVQEAVLNPYLAALVKLQRQHAQAPQEPAKPFLEGYGLNNVDCPLCENRGYIMYKKDGLDYARECDCMAQRRSLRRIHNSGMEDMLSRYSFDSYQTPDEARERIKRRAQAFAESDEGWFWIAGRSGSGKSHICTAICSELIARGKETVYMKWRDESRALKSLMNSDEVDEPLRRLKQVPVLYIDDFLKGGVTDADVRLAFEILNARYNDSRLRTILSSELSLREICELDEALGGRIYERSRGYRVKAPDENWRFK